MSLKLKIFYGIMENQLGFQVNGLGIFTLLSIYYKIMCFNIFFSSFGDFERTFLKVCSQSYPYFFDTFRSEKNFDIKFLNLNSQFCMGFNLLKVINKKNR